MRQPAALPVGPPCFAFEKQGPIIARPADMPAPGPYYTCLVDMRELPGFPYPFALYFSTDHHSGDGGIWLYVCKGDPCRAADWLSYDDARAQGAFDHLEQAPAANPIFRDHVQGNGHTETPHVNIIDGCVFMSYHRNGLRGSQKTLMATSPDGVNFARINGDDDSIILDYDVPNEPGNGHTGYFRWAPNVFADLDARFVGYSLHGGGDNYFSAMWISDDARSWTRRHIFTPTEGLALDNPEHIVIWHEIDPASIRRLPEGDYAAIAAAGNRASGSVKRVLELYMIYLSADGSRFTRQSRPLLRLGRLDDADSEELGSPTLLDLDVDGGLRLVYVGARGNAGENTIMAASGRFIG